MNAPALFPTLAGQGWSVHRRPTFSTRVAAHVSGREVRAPLFAQTLYEFELTVDGLSASADPALAGLGIASLQALAGFYMACRGRLIPFLYIDPSDNRVSDQTIGVGDGTTTSFVLQRSIGAYLEPAPWVTAVSAASVGGAAQSGYGLAAPNLLTFAAPPPAGARVAASFTYGYLCRFLDDQQDFENIAKDLWRVRSLRFRSVRTL